MGRFTEKDLRGHVEWIGSAAVLIQKHGPEAIRRDGGPRPRADGYPGGRGEGGRSADRTSSTERAGLAYVPDEHGKVRRQSDPVALAVRTAEDALLGAIQLLSIAVGQYAYGDELGKNEVGPRSHVQNCTNCGQPALPRLISGRCDECRVYRLTHNGKDRPVQKEEQAS